MAREHTPVGHFARARTRPSVSQDAMSFGIHHITVYPMPTPYDALTASNAPCGVTIASCVAYWRNAWGVRTPDLPIAMFKPTRGAIARPKPPWSTHDTPMPP